MPPQRNRRRPTLEPLEGRQLLSTLGPLAANTIDTNIGTVTYPRTVTSVPLAVRLKNLTARKHSTIIGLSAQPTPPRALRPALVGALSEKGRHLPFRPGQPFVPSLQNQALGYAQVSQAGVLQARLKGQHDTTGSALVTNYLPGDINGDGSVDFIDLRLFNDSYLSTPGDPNYNPAADANRNNYVGHGDARFLMRNLPPVTPKVPLRVDLALAPGQYAHGTNYENSGGITRLLHVTVVGRTTPGSIVFADSGLGDYTFTGRAIATDERGNFSIDFDLDPRDKLKNTEYLVIDPYGQQTIRAFPILYIG